MYQKTADLLHLHERTGSHATKGTGRGTVPNMTMPDPEAFDPRQERFEHKRKLREAMNHHRLAMAQFKDVLRLTDEAVARRDVEMVRALRPSVRALSKNLKKAGLELQELKRVDRSLRR